MKDEILNVGMDMAMEFGENWLRPIHERLSKCYPLLNETELEAYNQTCQEAMRFGHELLLECWQEAGRRKEWEPSLLEKLFGTPPLDPKRDFAAQLFEQRIKVKYPWMSGNNLRHLFSQSCYYAYKDGALD